MADDIVTRLRRVAQQKIEGHAIVLSPAQMLEAADEIEQLRKRLQACQSNDDYPLTDDCITQNERFLLAEVERLRAAGNAMFKVMTTRFADDDDWYAAIAAWQEGRRER